MVSKTCSLVAIVAWSLGGCGETVDAGADGGIDPCTSAGGTIELGVPGDTAVEGGLGVTYQVTLDGGPCAPVYVRPTPSADMRFVPTQVVFTPEDTSPRTVTAYAIQDYSVEGMELEVVSHEVLSADTSFEGQSTTPVSIAIADRVELAHASQSASGGAGDAPSSSGAVSDDGRYVVFDSFAGNLVAGGGNGYQNIFIRDLDNGATVMASRGTAGGYGNGASYSPVISGDGAYLAFSSYATNLVSTTVSALELYRYRVSDGAVELVTTPCTDCPANSTGIDVSADGDAIAYSTARPLLSDADTDYDVFVYQVGGGALEQASLGTSGSNGTQPNAQGSRRPRVSATGRYVGFVSAAHGLDTSPDITAENDHAYVKDLQSGVLVRVSRNHGGDTNCQGGPSDAPRVSSDGNLAAFTSGCAVELAAGAAVDDNGVDDVFVRDIAARTTERISVSSAGAQGNGPSALVGMSDDGRYVFFTSAATNLVPGDDNGVVDLFVRDRDQGTTRLLTGGPEGQRLANPVTFAAAARSGKFAVFVTLGSLLPSDDNTTLDVYRVQVY
jgi:Tol biopolymer transport system component